MSNQFEAYLGPFINIDLLQFSITILYIRYNKLNFQRKPARVLHLIKQPDKLVK
jgi:hypothetical protein